MTNPSPTRRVFIAWDSAQQNELASLLELLQESPNEGCGENEPRLEVRAPMLEDRGGDLWDVVADDVEWSDGVMAFVDRPNANVTFEVGYALGLGKLVWLVHHAAAVPSWTDREPFRGQLMRQVSSAAQARKLLRSSERLTLRVPKVPAHGGRTIVLCPATGAGEDVREVVQKALRDDAPLFDPFAQTFHDLPLQLAGVERVLWLLTGYPRGGDERDGRENAALAAVAGFLHAHGRELVVLQHAGARRVADVELGAVTWSRVTELRELLADFAASPAIERPGPVAVSDSIAAYCAHLRSWNERPVLFFEGTPSRSLQSIYVERELSEEPAEDAPALGEAAGRGRRRSTLSELIESHVTRTGSPGGAWLVLGAPGSGKTTLLRRLATDLAARYEEDDAAPLPVVLSLAHLAARRRSPFELVEEDLEGRAAGLAAELAAFAQEGRLWLLLDGLDEVRGRDRSELAFLLTSFVRLHPAVPVVITTRDEGRADLGLSPEPLRLLDLERPELLLEHWLPGRGAALWSSIERHPTLCALARNPLMLTLMAKLAEDGSELPARRGDLYEQVVTLLLQRGTDASGRGVVDPDAAADLLAPLALRLQCDGGESWSRSVLARHLRRCCHEPHFLADLKTAWASPSAFLDDLGARSGLLAPRRGPRQPWEFVHRSLREYLAARAWSDAGRHEEYLEMIADLRGRTRKGRDARDEVIAQWGETLVLLAGMVATADHCGALLEALRGFPGRLALRALPEATVLGQREGLAFLLATRGWGGDDLLALLRGWLAAGATADEVRAVVYARMQPELELEAAGRFLYALEELPLELELDEFFERWGRPRPVGGPADLEMGMVAIPGGSFVLGASTGDPMAVDWECPAHDVTLSAFELASRQVTREQFARLSGDAPEGDPRCPAVNLSWYAARLFCRWIGANLPTEAQWEYACRAGTTSAFWSGAGEEDLARAGWYAGNSEGTAHPVGAKPANPWGLFDMHGNVYEWCRDRMGSYDLPVETGTGLRRVTGSRNRVRRGGSFGGAPEGARSANRSPRPPGGRSTWLGFRPARMGRDA